MKTKILISLLVAFLSVTTLPAQINIDVKNKVNRKANQRANKKTDQAIDKTFDELEDGIGSLFGKKKDKKKGKDEKDNPEAGNNDQEVTGNFGDFTSLYPADDNVTVVPIHCNWEIPNSENYKFTVHLEGDDWSDWLTKTTNSNQVFFDNLPTSTKNLKWQLIAEGNGERIESPWQSFSITDDVGQATAKPASKPSKPNVQWAKFDFLPGDEIIFEDAPSADEENGEFPSRWDLIGGQVEIANVDGEPVIIFLDGGKIIPYLKNSSTDYLPEIFTIEFDFYRPKDGNRVSVYLTDQKNQKGLYENAQEFEITPVRIDAPGGVTAEHAGRDYTFCEEGCWTHVSIAFTNGKLKVYLDETRVINIPHYEFNPTGFTFYPYFADAGEDKAFYAKNFRIAKGGVKYYDRVLSDGKIIVNGIRFDVNKATIKPESNGAINEIFELMEKQADLNFSVEGHTDSDGDDSLNQKLSEQRAKAVMDRLISMGISANRLKSTGWGESKPIGGNDTSEGKANNRRVEFVKF